MTQWGKHFLTHLQHFLSGAGFSRSSIYRQPNTGFELCALREGQQGQSDHFCSSSTGFASPRSILWAGECPVSLGCARAGRDLCFFGSCWAVELPNSPAAGSTLKGSALPRAGFSPLVFDSNRGDLWALQSPILITYLMEAIASFNFDISCH